MTRGDVTSNEVQELAEEYLETREELLEAIGEWLDTLQEAVDDGEISYEAGELAVEFSAADEEEAYQRTLERGLMFPEWRPDTLGEEILDRPEADDGE